MVLGILRPAGVRLSRAMNRPARCPSQLVYRAARGYPGKGSDTWPWLSLPIQRHEDLHFCHLALLPPLQAALGPMLWYTPFQAGHFPFRRHHWPLLF